MAQDPNEDKKLKILMFVTQINHLKSDIEGKQNMEAKLDDKGRDTRQTGWYLPEVAHPYFEFRKAGFDVDFASPKGGEAEMDLNSYYEYVGKDKLCKDFFDIMVASDQSSLDFIKEEKEKERLKNLDVSQTHPSIKGKVYKDQAGDQQDISSSILKITINTTGVSGINYANYSTIFFAGGHGTCWDFYDSSQNKRNFEVNKMHELAANIYDKNQGVVAAVCHGPLALCGIKVKDEDSKDGKETVELVKGKDVAGFSNAEEKLMGLDQVVPLLEDALKAAGGKYSCADPWKPHVKSDKRVVSGQNPASATDTAKAVLKYLVKDE